MLQGILPWYTLYIWVKELPINIIFSKSSNQERNLLTHRQNCTRSFPFLCLCIFVNRNKTWFWTLCSTRDSPILSSRVRLNYPNTLVFPNTSVSKTVWASVRLEQIYCTAIGTLFQRKNITPEQPNVQMCIDSNFLALLILFCKIFRLPT